MFKYDYERFYWKYWNIMIKDKRVMDVCHTWPPLMKLVRAQTVPANFSSTNKSITKYSHHNGAVISIILNPTNKSCIDYVNSPTTKPKNISILQQQFYSILLSRYYTIFWSTNNSIKWYFHPPRQVLEGILIYQKVSWDILILQ